MRHAPYPQPHPLFERELTVQIVAEGKFLHRLEHRGGAAGDDQIGQGMGGKGRESVAVESGRSVVGGDHQPERALMKVALGKNHIPGTKTEGSGDPCGF